MLCLLFDINVLIIKLELKASSQQTLEHTFTENGKSLLQILPEKRVSIISRLLTIIRCKEIRMRKGKGSKQNREKKLSKIWSEQRGEGIINGEKRGKFCYGRTVELGK
jgi:hypothetical protein